MGRAEARALLCRLTTCKFDFKAGSRLAAALMDVTDRDLLTQVGDRIIECATASDLFACIPDLAPPSGRPEPRSPPPPRRDLPRRAPGALSAFEDEEVQALTLKSPSVR